MKGNASTHIPSDKYRDNYENTFKKAKGEEMIAIVNTGGDQLGICDYDVRINKDIIASFKHNRTDGLAKCLQEAAKAVEEARWVGAAEACRINVFDKRDEA